MILLPAMREGYWEAALLFVKHLLDALGMNVVDPRLALERGILHGTRIVEYPWALTVVEPKGRVLDIGSNPQFPLAMLSMGYRNITWHHTARDLPNLPLLHLPGTSVPLVGAFERYKGAMNLVMGDPDNLAIIADGTFDVIYNISVMEHVEPERVLSWMDGIWRMLKPGGKMVMTCDYPVEGEGEDCWKMDLMPWIRKVGAIVSHDEGCPWTEGFPGDASVVDWEKTDRMIRLVVFGFVLEKPAA